MDCDGKAISGQSGQDIRPHLAAAIRTDGTEGRAGRAEGVAAGRMQHI